MDFFNKLISGKLSTDDFSDMSFPILKMLIILIVGHIFTKYVIKLMKHAFKRKHVDKSIGVFLTKSVNIIFHAIVILVALSAVGISVKGAIAAFSAVALAAAVSFRDFLSNLVGGILLIIGTRFDTGDFIKTESDAGYVDRVDLLYTTLHTLDNRQIYIPNGRIINSHIINYTKAKKRRLDIVLGVSYSSDISEAKKIILNIVDNHKYVLKNPEVPFVGVKEYGKSSVNLIIKCWCHTNNYLPLYYEIIEEIRYSLEKSNITIPVEQMDVRILKDVSEKK